MMLAINNPPSACGQSDVIQENEIRSQHPQSGLYRNDGSNKPLWTVNWYAFDVEISSDGKYLARWGPWPLSNNYSELALAFYEEGREISKYRVNELVAIPELLPHSVSHYMWVKSASFDDQNNLLFVETENGEKYTFDITNGAIMDGNRPIPRLFIALAVGGVAMLIYVVLHVRQQRNSARRKFV